MLRFRWSRLRLRYGDGAAVIDEAIVGAAPWRWRTGRPNRRDGEMDEDPHPGRWTRDVELLRWTVSSGKRLQLGGGRSRVWGFVVGFFAALVYEWVGGWDGSGEDALV